MRKVVIKTCLIFIMLSNSVLLAAEKNNILLLITPVLGVPKPKIYVSTLFSASTTVSSHGLCTWNHNITGTGTAELVGNGPYDLSFSFSGLDVIFPIPQTISICVEETESINGTEQVIVGVDRKIDVTVSLGERTGQFVGEISEDLNVIIGTFTVDNQEFDYPASGPLILTKK